MNPLRRRKNGRFAKGNAGGPGRPAEPAEPKPLRDADLLEVERQLEESNEASWWFLFDNSPRPKFLKLVAFAIRRGERIPEGIAAQLRKELEP